MLTPWLVGTGVGNRVDVGSIGSGVGGGEWYYFSLSEIEFKIDKYSCKK